MANLPACAKLSGFIRMKMRDSQRNISVTHREHLHYRTIASGAGERADAVRFHHASGISPANHRLRRMSSSGSGSDGSDSPEPRSRGFVDIVYTLSDNCEVISWDEAKNRKLRAERGIGFEDAVEEIVGGRVLDILEHRIRRNQKLFVILLGGRVCVVPFVLTGEDIFLKTIYPSRKLQRRYGKTANPNPA